MTVRENLRIVLAAVNNAERYFNLLDLVESIRKTGWEDSTSCESSLVRDLHKAAVVVTDMLQVLEMRDD
jgi:hypothetical protein